MTGSAASADAAAGRTASTAATSTPRTRPLRTDASSGRGAPFESPGGGSPLRGSAQPSKGGKVGFEQYHEPAGELTAETRTFARMLTSLTEEAEAIGWYEQRMSLEPDAQAKAIMANAQREEFKHFGMDLEF